MALEEYPPLTEAELDEWEASARGPKDWSAEYVLRLIAEIRRLRKAQEAPPERPLEEMMPPLSAEERRARVMAAAGSMAHLPGSVDGFLQRKQEDIALEEERWERRQQGRCPTPRGHGSCLLAAGGPPQGYVSPYFDRRLLLHRPGSAAGW